MNSIKWKMLFGYKGQRKFLLLRIPYKTTIDNGTIKYHI